MFHDVIYHFLRYFEMLYFKIYCRPKDSKDVFKINIFPLLKNLKKYSVKRYDTAVR